MSIGASLPQITDEQIHDLYRRRKRLIKEVKQKQGKIRQLQMNSNADMASQANERFTDSLF